MSMAQARIGADGLAHQRSKLKYLEAEAEGHGADVRRHNGQQFLPATVQAEESQMTAEDARRQADFEGLTLQAGPAPAAPAPSGFAHLPAYPHMLAAAGIRQERHGI